MKFRARTTDQSFIRTFAQLLSALSRCSRSFILRITSDKLIFVLSEKEAAIASNAVSIWGEVPNEPYFREYAMEGVSMEDNEIYLQILPDTIAGCLSTLRSTSNSVDGLKIKLTKKHAPCLTFEVDFHNAAEGTVPTCTHDVPVKLISRKLWGHYRDPFVPAFDISIGGPEVKNFRLALERLKNIDQHLRVKASSSGALILSASTCTVKCTVSFKDLQIYDIGEGGTNIANNESGEVSPPPDEIKEFSVTVNMKSIAQFISSDLNSKPSSFVISVTDELRFHMYLLFDDISLQYSVPTTAG